MSEAAETAGTVIPTTKEEEVTIKTTTETAVKSEPDTSTTAVAAGAAAGAAAAASESATTSKRKREEEEQEANGDANKKKLAASSTVVNPASSTPSTTVAATYTTTTTMATGPAPTSASTNIISVLSHNGDSETIEVPPDKVGQIIGPKGAVIQDMQTRSGAKIFLNQDFPPGVNRQVTITGTPVQVKTAGDLVKLVLKHGPTAIHANSLTGGPTVNLVIECPHSIVGRVIGGQGSTIKELQSRSGAKIQIDQNFPEGVPRKINVSGTQAAIAIATQLISYVMENGPTLPPANVMGIGGGMGGGGSGQLGQPYVTQQAGPGGQMTQTMDCPKAFVGKIIGRGGETISMIQQRSGAKVQIDQNVQPCKVNMSGMAHNVAVAANMIQEIILGHAGGAGGGVGAMGGGAFGMAAPHMQTGALGGLAYGQMAQPPYGSAAPAMAAAYGGQYGMAVQQPQAQPSAYGQHTMGGAGLGLGGHALGGYGQPHQQQQHNQLQQHHHQQQQPFGGGGYPAPAPTAPAPKPVAKLWSEHKTDDGNTYWYNSSTGVSQWERPLGF